LLGRAGLVFYIFSPNFKNGFEVAILGLKGGESWRRFRQENFQKHELLKNPLNPFGTKRKISGKGRFSLGLVF
jgi:hypothetical protein